MYSRLKLAQKYFHYYVTAANGKGHGTHSPFVFDFIIHVLNDDERYADYDRIERLRGRLRSNPTLLEVEDMGAGSVVEEGLDKGGRFRKRSIAHIARHAAKSRRLGQLLFRISRYYRPSTILELGTSLGISTAYLAAGNPLAQVWTIEGAGAVAKAAGSNLESLGLSVQQVTGNFDVVLSPTLDRMGPVGLAFVDGNHRKEPTIRYFNELMGRMAEQAILIFDDIHWSEDMEEAWDVIRKDPRVYLAVDLFFIGIVFLREEFKVKQEFVIRF